MSEVHRKTWQQRFTNEFGSHFLLSELQFALEFIEEVRKESFEEGRDIGMEADEVLRAEGRKEERAFVLNILNGIDIADSQMGNAGGGTKAIRHALSTRA